MDERLVLVSATDMAPVGVGNNDGWEGMEGGIDSSLADRVAELQARGPAYTPKVCAAIAMAERAYKTGQIHPSDEFLEKQQALNDAKGSPIEYSTLLAQLLARRKQARLAAA